MRRVTAINNGTVIDHIPAGSALSVLRMLGISDDRASPISLVMNVPSSKHGRKDIIKVEDRELTQSELNRLALVAPDAHVAIIRAYSVAEKLTIEFGDEIVNVVRCTISSSVLPPPYRLPAALCRNCICIDSFVTPAVDATPSCPGAGRTSGSRPSYQYLSISCQLFDKSQI